MAFLKPRWFIPRRVTLAIGSIRCQYIRKRLFYSAFVAQSFHRYKSRTYSRICHLINVMTTSLWQSFWTYTTKYAIWVIPSMGNRFKTICCLIITQFHNLINNFNKWTLANLFDCLSQFPQLLCFTSIRQTWMVNWLSSLILWLVYNNS